MKETLYSRRSNLVVGFHGCDASVVEKVVLGQERLLGSTNDYDWLGHGIYFWENNETRAWQYAEETAGRKNSSVTYPAVVGAVIDLGFCMDLTDSLYLAELREAYDALVKSCEMTGVELPRNQSVGHSQDKLYSSSVGC